MRPSSRLLAVVLLVLLSATTWWIVRRVARSTTPNGGIGTLIVRVEDAETRAPLTGMAVRLFRERGGARILALGTTDARGEARFEDVEANTVIAHALRAPPYAQAFGAVWLEGDETETVVLAMHRGKFVRGRVVDDAGAPLAGAEVVLEDAFGSHHRPARIPESEAVLVATTSADGAFEVAHLAPWPQGVTIESGRMIVRDWWPQSVEVRFEDARVDVLDRHQSSAALEDVGEVVVPPASTWAGRVLDAHGAPVPGALVSTREERGWGGDHRARADLDGGSWPGAAGFRMLAGESITDSDGRFVVRGRPLGPRLVVWTSPGMLQAFPAADLEPGRRIDGLELRIDDAHLIVLELVDARGERIRGRVGILLRDAQGDSARAIDCDPDGLYRVQLPGLVRDVSRLSVDVSGYAPSVIDVPREGGDPVRVVLEKASTLRVSVRFADRRIDALDRRFLELDACIVDPRDSKRVGRPACCGLGAHEFLEFAPGTREFELPVLADRPYFVSLREYEGGWAQTFGPWRPGTDVHELVVPELTEQEPASVSARVADARTGEPISAWLDLDPVSAGVVAASEAASHQLSGDGRAEPVPAGRWRVRLHARGYRVPAPIEIDLAEGDERVLGPFALERTEPVAVEFVGTSPRVPPRILLTDERGLELAIIGPREVQWNVWADLPARGYAIVDEPLDSVLERSSGGPYAADAGWRSQTIAFEHDGGRRLELRLARWRAVEVRCPYVGPIELAARVEVDVVDPRLEGRSRRRHFIEGVPDRDDRRFTDWLAPGAYVARARSLVLGDCEARFDVPASGDEVVRVELKPVR